MRLKTFLATYLLFLCIIFSILGIVSAYMTNSQISVLKDKSMAEYQTISTSLTKDIAVLSVDSGNLAANVKTLVAGYVKYYKKNSVDIEVAEISAAEQTNGNIEMSFINSDGESYIYITGTLPQPFQNYRFDYHYDITKNVASMRSIQDVLLAICVVFSVIAAFALYFILYGIFRPLGIVADTSRQIAGGDYGKRIKIKGDNELSKMAGDFNTMAEQIERQIHILEDEAAQKQQFVDNFAHEIRTPLTSIYGYAEYMQKVSLSEEEIIESAQFIIDEAEHMKKISNSLLDLATLRIYEPVKNKISIQKLFEDINQTLKKTLSEKGVTLICQSGADFLEGQEDLMKSLLLNLCFNAIKACAANEGVIRLEAREENGAAVLSVTDNGCGIPKESIAKVAEPFYRVDKARSREEGGAGLGLALCRQIAEVHGAEMTIESAAKKGTTITITFTSS